MTARCGSCGAAQPAFYEAGCLEFARALAHAPRSEYLSSYTLAELNELRCFLRRDKRVGYALTRDGELTCVFNAAEPGAGRAAVRNALERGAVRLNCFDGFLPGYYAALGFRETHRVAFDPMLAPAGWTHGTPDVVFMEVAL